MVLIINFAVGPVLKIHLSPSAFSEFYKSKIV